MVPCTPPKNGSKDMHTQRVPMARATLLGVLFLVAGLPALASPSGTPGAAFTDFTGPFAIGNWTLVETPAAGGGVSTSPGPPLELYLVGGNSAVAATSDFQITVPADGTIQFDWGFESLDLACWDEGGYAVNGAYLRLACNGSGIGYFSGTASVPVSSGDLFAFRVITQDGAEEPGTLGVTGFQFQALGPAVIGLDATSLSASLATDTQQTLPVTMTNLGGQALAWQVIEAEAARRPGYVARGPVPAGHPVVRSAAECARYQHHAGAEPEGYALHCLQPQPAAVPAGVIIGGSDSLAYVLDVGFVSDNFAVHALDDFPGQTVLGANPRSIYAMDFDALGASLYAIDTMSRELGTISLLDGSFVPHALLSGVAAGENVSGLTIDPASGAAWISGIADGSGMTLYSLDLATGFATPIGTDPERFLMIDIAIGPQGVMYGHDIATDAIYTIDVATAQATLVGATGLDASFAQGMDFDNSDGTLYAYMYRGGGNNDYGTIDLATGAFTALSTNSPTGEFEGAIRSTLDGAPACESPSEVSWLSVAPMAGTLSPSASQAISVTVSAAGLSPGVYSANLCVRGSQPITLPVVLPVELTVFTQVCLFADGFESGGDGSCGP